MLLDDLPPFPDGPSAVAVGVGRGPFGAGNLYVVTFDGNVIELPAAVAPAAVPRLYLRVQPRVVRRGQRRRFDFQAVVSSLGVTYPAGRALIRFAGKRRRTDAGGRAAIRARFRRARRVRARVSQPGVQSASASVRVRKR